MDDLLKEFLTETAENLALIDSELVRFERNPHDAATLSNIFRLVHTIKGTCGFLGLGRLESLAHAGENVLGRIRDGRLAVDAAAVTVILRCIDTIRGLLTELENTGAEPAGEDTALIDHLNAIAEGQVAALPSQEQPADAFPVAQELIDEVTRAQAAGYRAATEAELSASIHAERNREQAEASFVASATPAAAPADTDKAAASGEAAPATPESASPPPPASDPAGAPTSVAAQSIRVPVETLETLMTLVSELVLTRNQLLQIVRTRDDNQLTVPLQRLSHITSELQEGVMKTRMQPIGNAWGKLPRIVRDLGLETGKKLELRMIGADTELDRQVLELIKDPLTHMVRNSADHGIESPAERKKLGKPETGTVSLNAYHEGGHIIIEIADDGRGLNVLRIREKILSKGLATAAELEAMTDNQAAQFIFRAGFSTAEKVTSVSGRGVGMDVVRTNIEKIGGTIDLRNVPGKSCTFIIKIPLTLAIVAALIVQSAGQRFAIPQISVVELVRVTANSQARVETINGSPLLRLRDRLLPLADLRTLLKLDGGGDQRAGGALDELFVVVSQVGACRFGVIVDEVFDTEEIVVKPVAPILRRIPHYAGNTILGDGGVIMILDPNGLAAACGLLGSQSTEAVAAAGNSAEQKTALLLFRAGGVEPKAIPLELVARLERIDLAKVEKSQGSRMMQYRGLLMPLIPFAPDHQWAEAGTCPILVFTDRERAMGLVVDEIVDIVEDYLHVEVVADGEGLIGSAVINGAATEIIDAGHYLLQAFPDWFATRDKLQSSSASGRVLLVDDSPFFRSLIKPVLEAAGYQVTAVNGADQALQLRDEGQRYDAIISDIEMPGLNGFDFARTVREDNRWAAVPMVALSSHTSVADLARGRAVGFDDYVAKFDRDGLMASLGRTLHGHSAVAA